MSEKNDGSTGEQAADMQAALVSAQAYAEEEKRFHKVIRDEIRATADQGLNVIPLLKCLNIKEGLMSGV